MIIDLLKFICDLYWINYKTQFYYHRLRLIPVHVAALMKTIFISLNIEERHINIYIKYTYYIMYMRMILLMYRDIVGLLYLSDDGIS